MNIQYKSICTLTRVYFVQFVQITFAKGLLKAFFYKGQKKLSLG